ncbi:hypothetical protein HY230_08405, partial [Candidatus Acetothermia bacterium]|nr:hypothetical protein [Candidatus Acetothermia bacterium]
TSKYEPDLPVKLGESVKLIVRDAGGLLKGPNLISLTLVTADQGKPATEGPELHPVSLEFSPPSPVKRGEIVLIRSRIENTGSQFTGPFTVDFQIFKVDTTSGTIKFVAALGETRHFPGIDPSVTIEASTLLDTCARDASGTCTLELGTYIVKVVVSTVPNELDRTNNELSTLLTIQAPKK